MEIPIRPDQQVAGVQVGMAQSKFEPAGRDLGQQRFNPGDNVQDLVPALVEQGGERRAKGSTKLSPADTLQAGPQRYPVSGAVDPPLRIRIAISRDGVRLCRRCKARPKASH